MSLFLIYSSDAHLFCFFFFCKQKTAYEMRIRDGSSDVCSSDLDWAAAFTPGAEWSGAILRSLLTLKALTHRQTGGIVAAGTTSLPEQPGGSRNWDYRLCWLRDSTFTLYALIGGGFLGEAQAWREWLLRAVAGDPADLQIMYGIAGERRLVEYEVPWLPGYGGASPVRVGNAAAGQLQLDVYGEVMDTLYVARKAGLPPRSEEHTSELQSLMRISYAVFCLKKKKNKTYIKNNRKETKKKRTVIKNDHTIKNEKDTKDTTTITETVQEKDKNNQNKSNNSEHTETYTPPIQ